MSFLHRVADNTFYLHIMKRTLFIALLAMCGMAQAAEPVAHTITMRENGTDTLSSGLSQININGGESINFDNGWMMEFTVNSSTLAEGGKKVIFRAQGDGGGGLEISLIGNNGIALSDGWASTMMSQTISLTLGTMYRVGYDIQTETLYLTNTETGDFTTGSWADNGYANMGTHASVFRADSDNLSVTVGTGYDMNGITGDAFKSYVTAVQSYADMYWQGTTDGTWSDASWSTSATDNQVLRNYREEAVAHFTDLGGAAIAVTISGSTTTAGINVSGGEYQFNGAYYLAPLPSLTVSNDAIAKFDNNITADVVEISGTSTLLSAKNITVNATLNMSSGNLIADKLEGSGVVEITGGTIQLTNGSEVTGGTTITDATIVDSTLNGSDAAPISIGAVHIDGSSTTLSNITLNNSITVDNGNLAFDGIITIGKEFAGETQTYYSKDTVDKDSGNGYRHTTTNYYVLKDTDMANVFCDTTTTTWMANGSVAQWNGDGTVFAESKMNYDIYWVLQDEVNYDSTLKNLLQSKATSQIIVEGGHLVIPGEYNSKSNIVIRGTGSAVTAQDIYVTESLSMSGGSLTANRLMGEGSVIITGGELELTNGSEVTGGVSITNATIVGDTVLAGTTNTPIAIGDSTIKANSVTIADASVTGTIHVESGKLTLQGTMKLDPSFKGTDIHTYSLDGKLPGSDNGYRTEYTQYVVITGDIASVDATAARWRLNDNRATWLGDGTVMANMEIDTDVYYINKGVTTYDKAVQEMLVANETEDIELKGGTLEISCAYTAPIDIVAAQDDSTIILSGEGALKRSSIKLSSAGILLDGDGSYDTEHATYLHEKGAVSLADSWTGTVYAGNIEAEALNISHLTRAGSKLKMGNVTATSIVSGAAAAITAQTLTLSRGASVLDAQQVTLNALSLGSDAAAASLTTSGVLAMKGSVTLGNVDSTLKVGSLSSDTKQININMSEYQLTRTGSELVLMQLTDEGVDASEVVVTLNNSVETSDSKYFRSIHWNDKGNKVILSSTFNPEYYNSHAYTSNGIVGAALLTKVAETPRPRTRSQESDLDKVMDSIDILVTKGYNGMSADTLMAATAGSSTATLGLAMSADMERQMQAIRNRTSQMGLDQRIVNENLPYFNAWVNAEGNHSKQGADGTMPGYTLSNWGATVGADANLNDHWTVGLAFTNMRGDLTSDGPDHLDGEMDTYYVTPFARYKNRAWSHSFIGSFGIMDSSYDRVVNYVGGSYSTNGSAKGVGFGLMYEVGRSFAITETGSTSLQPVLNISYRYNTVEGYDENGGDAALSVGRQRMGTVTLGAGLRMHTVVGESIYNRSSFMELRGMLKAYTGDRQNDASVALRSGNAGGEVSSAEQGAVGFEMGVGITIPLGASSGSLFMDGSVEVRSDYTNVNGTIGYRYNF